MQENYIIKTGETERGVKIVGLKTNPSPEELAAIGACLSRDPSSLVEKLKIMTPEIMERIIELYYVKYGHGSIGDMGFFPMSAEGLSMLEAYYLVESRLFNGQEASTRYINFLKSGYFPINKQVDEISQKFFDIYKEIFEETLKYLIEVKEMQPKAAKPQALDIAGGFLPISARTNVYTIYSLRSLEKQIKKLYAINDASSELALTMKEVFEKLNPHARFDLKIEEEKAKRNFHLSVLEDYFAKNRNNLLADDVIVDWSNFNSIQFKHWFADKKEIRKLTTEASSLLGTISVIFNIDFRSSRDIHRHRSLSLNEANFNHPQGIEEFYFDKIPKEIREKIKDKVEKTYQEALKLNSLYCLPMATKFPHVINGDITSLSYLLNLRSSNKVHPTVREKVVSIGEKFYNELNCKLHQDTKTNYDERSKDEGESIV